jgi:diguanylate cyclase (GGDEF)-like protein
MPHVGRMRLLERQDGFRDAAERRLFWESAVESSRHLAVSIQFFGFLAWLASRVFANPQAGFDGFETLFAVGGMLAATALTYAARNVRMDALGRFACAAFVALAFHSNVTATQSPAFWVLPMGVAINVAMAPAFSGYLNYLASAVLVWLIISHGEVSTLLHSPDRNWIVLFVPGSLWLGLLLNLLFARERKKTFLVQQELSRLAFRDALTEIRNRRSFMLALHACRNGLRDSEAWLLLIDVDDFKQINDTSGHETGDQVLIAAAQAIERCADPHVCGRLGGEEFGVVFSGSIQNSYVLADQICRTVERLEVEGHTVTVSIGIARIAQQIGVPDTFRLADRGLYEAKRQGKNRYVLVNAA